MSERRGKTFKQGAWSRALLGIVVTAICVFSVAPLAIIVASSFTTSTVVSFPPEGFGFTWYREIFAVPGVVSALRNSVVLGALTVAGVLVLSFIAAYGLRRIHPRTRGPIELYLQSPLLLPQIVLGFGLVQLFVGMGLINTLTELLIAHIIITFPYGYRTIAASLHEFQQSQEDAALTLGCSRPRAIFEIVLPQLRSGIMAGAIFIFVLSFDNVTISLWLIGPDFNVLPMWLFSYVQNSTDPLPSAVATIILVVSLVAVFILEKTVGLGQRLGSQADAKTPISEK